MQNIINTKNKLKEINKQLKLLINFIEKLYTAVAANIATAAASRNPKQALKFLTELITLYNTGKGLYLGKIV